MTHGRFAIEEFATGGGRKVTSTPSAASSSRRTDSLSPSPSPSPVPSPVNSVASAGGASIVTSADLLPLNLNATLASSLASYASSLLPPPPREPASSAGVHRQAASASFGVEDHATLSSEPATKASNPRRTIWKCKRCTFK